jgi:hypothetical protein
VTKSDGLVWCSQRRWPSSIWWFWCERATCCKAQNSSSLMFIFTILIWDCHFVVWISNDLSPLPLHFKNGWRQFGICWRSIWGSHLLDRRLRCARYWRFCIGKWSGQRFCSKICLYLVFCFWYQHNPGTLPKENSSQMHLLTLLSSRCLYYGPQFMWEEGKIGVVSSAFQEVGSFLE